VDREKIPRDALRIGSYHWFIRVKKIALALRVVPENAAAIQAASKPAVGPTKKPAWICPRGPTHPSDTNQPIELIF